jgi:regulation of enolase protein 1 (concanavalin A-like superfamily)
MNASVLRAPLRRLRGFLILVSVLTFFALQLPLRAQLYTESSPLPNVGSYVAMSGDTLVGAGEGYIPQHQDVQTWTTSVWVRGPSGWTRQGDLQYRGGDVAINGDTIVIGDKIYARSNGVWTYQAQLAVDDTMVLAIQGDTVVQASPYDRAQSWGQVRIYVRTGTTWSLQTTLGPHGNEPERRSEELGTSVALDGNTLIAGTRGYQSYNFGAEVYVRNGSTWTYEATLILPDAGWTMDVALEGNTAAVSDPLHNRVGIFTRSGSSWTLAQTLSGAAGSSFGTRIVMKGGVLAVKRSGGFSLYTRGASGWALAQDISGPNSLDMALSERGKDFVTGAVYDTGVSIPPQIYSVPPPPAPGSGWRDFDIGAVGVAGSSSDNGATVAVRGSGADMWGGADQFHYRTESMTGDGAIIARVDAIGNGHPWSKVGLMAREDIAPAARNVLALVAAGGPVGMQVRSATADNTNFTEAPWVGAPLWLMLARKGDLFATYRSDDGNNWTPIGSATVAMPATIHVGLAVSSHDNTTLNTGTFSHLELVGLTPPSNDPPAAPSNLQAGNQTSTTVALSWSDNSSDETGFEVQRSVGDGSGAFTVVTTTAAGVTSYVDSALTPDTDYTYRVRAVRDGTFSANSNTFTVRTLSDSNPGLTSVDIGNVGVAGSTSASGNAVTLNAGGEDIWNLADGFRFYYRQWSGDGTLTAHVAALTNKHPWAKAGVMIRESLAPESANAMMLLTAENVCGLQSRPTTGAPTEFIGGDWLNAPYWVRLTRTGNVFSGYVSPDGVTWTLVGSRTIAMSSAVYVGLAACAHTTSAQTTASFDNVTLPNGAPPPPPPPPPPPSEWTQQLWGSATGSFSATSTGLTVTATGDDIWNASDSGFYAWKTWSGDGEFAVRVDSITPTHPWAKAGIMFRAGSGADAINAFAAITAGVGAIFQTRGTAGESSMMIRQDWNPGPGAWLKLKREDSYAFFAYYSVDEGASWVALGRQTLLMSGDIQVGFAVSSHVNSTSTSASFSHIRVSPAAPSHVAVTHLGPSGEVNLAWTDNAAHETGFVIEIYSQNDGRDAAFRPFMTVPAGTTNAVFTLSQGQYYEFRVRAQDGSLTSGHSNASGAETTITPTLTVQGATSTSVSLHWEARENSIGGSFITGPYSLERSTDGANFVEIAGNIRTNGSNFVYTDTGLTPNTAYYYRVRYLDNNGNTSGYGTLPGPVRTTASP